MRPISRRQAVLTGALAGPLASVLVFRSARAEAASGAAAALSSVPEGLRFAQLHGGSPLGLLGTDRDGGLWALEPAQGASRRLAEGLHPSTPLASGHGRIAARLADGRLWVWEAGAGTAQQSVDGRLAPHAGLCILPQAVISVAAADQRLVRFEPDGAGRWRPVARSQEAILPDARPFQVDLDGRGDGGHVLVLAGPDDQRYRHAVLGDAVEATRVLWLERHSLVVLRALELPAPHVIEDIAPRPVVLPNRRPAIGLLTVRAGPAGGQLALLDADPVHPERIRLAALGDPVGGFHRWLAPTTDGGHLAAVHTPHIGGVLQTYAVQGQRLVSERRTTQVSTHAIGARETDLAVWLRGRLVLPSQDRRSLLVLRAGADWGEEAVLPLPAPVVQATTLRDGSAWVGLLDDGRVWMARVGEALPATPR
jgi:hypothetical protein